MSTNLNGSGGVNVNPGGNPDDKSKKDDAPILPKKDDTVSFESYQKVLDEKKAKDRLLADATSKLEAFEKADRDRQETEAKAKGDLETLLKLEREKRETAEKQASEIKESLTRGAKLRSVLKSLSGEIEDQYLGLIDISQVVIDPTTGQPDDLSAKKVAKDFEEKFSRVIVKPGAAKLPNGAPASGANAITLEEWKKLPLDQMKKRLKDVINQTP